MVLAHRVAWSLWGEDELTPDLFVLHKNDLPDCVDPRFLFLGTNLDNMQDMAAKGRTSRISRNKGEANGSTNLKTHEVLEIYQRAKAGEIQHVIARDFGVCRSTVSNIKLSKRWGHITSELAAAT
jgi:hypothetical protein